MQQNSNLELIEVIECRGCTCTYTYLELSEAVDCRGCQIANTCTYTNLELSEAVEAVKLQQNSNLELI